MTTHIDFASATENKIFTILPKHMQNGYQYDHVASLLITQVGDGYDENFDEKISGNYYFRPKN